MEKRGRGGNMPSSQTLQLPASAPRKERRPSMFEESVSAAAGRPVSRAPPRFPGSAPGQRGGPLGGGAGAPRAAVWLAEAAERSAVTRSPPRAHAD